MDNPETLATPETRHRTKTKNAKTQNIKQKTEKTSRADPQ